MTIRRLGIVIAASFVVAACRDQNPTEPPASTTTGSFELELPETVLAGQPFTLTVTAVAQDGTRPDADFDGTVTLSASAGSLTPATIMLTSGVATTQVTLNGTAGEVSIQARTGNATGARSVTAIGNAAVARIQITPSVVLLTGAGTTQQLTAQAFDAAGLPTRADLTWRSSSAGVVAIDGDGIASAVNNLGSAQIVAAAAGVESLPALALVATPANDAVLVADSLVVSDAVAVDDPESFGLGWRYQVRLRGLNVEAGQILVGTGERRIGGRVVSVNAAAGGEMDVVLELIPLSELMPQLRIDELIPLVDATEPAQQPGANLLPGRNPQGYAFGAFDPVKFKLGRFDCEASGSLPSLDLPTPKLDVTPSIALQIGYATPGGGLQRLAAVGSIEADVGYKPVVKAVFEGDVGCKTKLRTLILPIGGWFSWFFGAQVPLGVGFALNAKLEIAEVGFDVKANATATVELGMDCPPGGSCTGITTFETTRGGSFEFIAPDPTDQFRLELGGHGYLWANLTVGSPLSESAQFETIAAKAGLKQSVDLATAHRQAEDTAYASSFKLAFLATIASGKDLDAAVRKLGDLLGIDLKLDLKLLDINKALAESPQGSFTITPASVAPGDSSALGELATFTVELDSVKYLGLESVEKVEIFWKKETGDGDDFTLEPGRPGCTDISASPGLKKFECTTDFLAEHEGEQTFYAFVHAKLFGFPLPLPLEIANDAFASVSVGGECPAPPEWAVPETFVGWGPFAVEGDWEGNVERLDYNGARMTAYTKADSGLSWSPSVRTTLGTADYIRIIPIDGWPADNVIILKVRNRGRVSAELTAGDSETRRDHDEAEISVGFPLGPARLLSADATDDLGAVVVREIDEIVNVTWREQYDWSEVAGSVQGYMRTRGFQRGAYVEAEYDWKIVGAEDSNGNPLDVRVCSASGTQHLQ